ncbi:MAG: Mo-dependent nitrogenase C-terminal domain-containing protein [Synechococcales cyanobacterium C42_A2020_086]|jgi:hypothetical protein|nr:Mo-dependent nitrogenase C-terminal domain-containing protein [Synechococcales cyanobacterium C42_A2020_086]
MNASQPKSPHPVLVTWSWITHSHVTPAPIPPQPTVAPLRPLRNWLNNLSVENPWLAHKLCQLIPAQCPFERDVKLGGRTLFHIPPLCKLNPLYEEVVGLRFRALCYLADVCGEDISRYC